jgi:hypothetical protein
MTRIRADEPVALVRIYRRGSALQSFKFAHDAQILRVSVGNIQPWHRVATFQGHPENK